MRNQIQIEFQLLGTTTAPKEITKKVGILPNIELMRGERNAKLNLPRMNIWAIRSQSESDDVVNHWESLELALNRSKDIIKEIADNGTAKITIIIKSPDRIPSIIIPPSMSRFAGFINAVIDIDHLQ